MSASRALVALMDLHAVIGGAENSNRENPRRNRRGRARTDAAVSPDGRWQAFVRDNNVFIRATEGGALIRLTAPVGRQKT